MIFQGASQPELFYDFMRIQKVKRPNLIKWTTACSVHGQTGQGFEQPDLGKMSLDPP